MTDMDVFRLRMKNRHEIPENMRKIHDFSDSEYNLYSTFGPEVDEDIYVAKTTDESTGMKIEMKITVNYLDCEDKEEV